MSRAPSSPYACSITSSLCVVRSWSGRPSKHGRSLSNHISARVGHQWYSYAPRSIRSLAAIRSHLSMVLSRRSSALHPGLDLIRPSWCQHTHT
jgi:hypothetical protein